MSGPPSSSNPRRRPARAGDAASSSTDSAALADCFQSMSIRKGDTFHPQSNTCQSDFWDPLEERIGTPSTLRSTTSPKALEDLLVGAGERRVATLLERVDQAVAINSKQALAGILSEPEVLPLPKLTVTEASRDSTPTARPRTHSHSSDSGLGSSIADSMEIEKSSPSTGQKCSNVSLPSPPSNITPVVHSTPSDQIDSMSSAADEERGLSKYAAEQIHKHIVEPILREESLKEFHELIESVPLRIGDKEIKTLRDLEKTLIFLAPDYSRSPSKYLRFCERTIRVLHTTVTTLHESDQRAPTDRPYTQGYFFDLVEQIRRYATILAVTREKEAKGEKLDKMDVQKDEKVILQGGMSHNGKPAELVRQTADGKIISITTGKELSEAELASASSMKRPAELDVDDDEAFRSMARRKKNAKPEIHTCELCQKEFKRPCDLTKHVKTHERPWKCSEVDCKYHEYGWPTEKERDRHVNDKHSDTPALYHCQFKPCPYTSKRESNCKQHMEKAHGWNYVRSKNNGKARASTTGPLPTGSIPPSPAMSSRLTPIAPSPSTKSWAASSRSGSMAPPSIAGSSSHITPFVQPSPDFASHFNMNFDFNDMAGFPTSAFPVTPAMSAERRASGTLSSYSDLQFDQNSFDSLTPADLVFDDFSDLNNFTGNYGAYTPNSAVGSSASLDFPHMSPAQHMENAFTCDAMNLDGSAYMDAPQLVSAGPEQDFTLFGGGNLHSGGATGLFPSLASPNSWNEFDASGVSTTSAFAPFPATASAAAHADQSLDGDIQQQPHSSQQQQQHAPPPQLLVTNSTIAELFPELHGQ